MAKKLWHDDLVGRSSEIRAFDHAELIQKSVEVLTELEEAQDIARECVGKNYKGC